MNRPFVISWNLTYRCNLACEHCYLDAGAKRAQKLNSGAFADRSELSTEQCRLVIDQIAEFAPECLTILTGGEPLLRRDILEIIRYANKQKLWVVVGTNGVLVSEALSEHLREAGVRGLALSLDSLDESRHDAFRAVKGAFHNTVNGAKILHAVEMPFLIQTTIGQHNVTEFREIASYVCHELGARVWNVYFLVSAGRGAFVSDISEAQYQSVLFTLAELQREYSGKMLVNAKCAPHFSRYLFEHDRQSDHLKSYAEGFGGCPAGKQYLGIRPNGDVTPCPYLPTVAGNLMHSSLRELSESSVEFKTVRNRQQLEGRCGNCEFSSACGGCRARAFGTLGSVTAEDPLCDYQPGQYSREDVSKVFSAAVTYGEELTANLDWEDEARARVERIPAFVRGMVVKRIEAYCRENDISVVTAGELETLRSRMPTRKFF